MGRAAGGVGEMGSASGSDTARDGGHRTVRPVRSRAGDGNEKREASDHAQVGESVGPKATTPDLRLAAVASLHASATWDELHRRMNGTAG
jgi:hypothetical protein